ncbi:hypothetical protein BGZ76_010223 [Entomortierella beljakovae]|nr:hypothetical protein BGZ76_010223 [Entomortierella beljakovae]
MEETESTPQQAIVLTIRPSTGPTFTTAISTESTVLQLKEKLATPEFPVSSIRLVYSGRVLNDDDQLASYSIKEGHTIHMVKSATNRANEQAVQTARPVNNSNAPGSDGFDEQSLMATLLDNPAIRDMMANPEVVRRMMMANPQTREVMENNPEVAQMLNDPSFLRQSLDIARNPKLMKQALRNNDRALSNLEMIPGGFNHLRRMYHSVQEPMEASRSAPEPSTDDLNARFAARLNADTTPQAGQLNSTPLPNPWAPPPRQNNTARSSPMFSGMPGMGGNTPGGLSPFSMFGSPFSGLEPPGSGTNGQTGNTQAPFSNPFGAMMNQRMGGFGAGSQSQPNPFAPSGFGEPFSPMGNSPEMFQQMMQLQQMMRPMQQQQQQPLSQTPSIGGTSFANLKKNSTQSPEERFETQLASLRDMGFSDNTRNLQALLASGGDVNSAIEYLLNM